MAKHFSRSDFWKAVVAGVVAIALLFALQFEETLVKASADKGTEIYTASEFGFGGNVTVSLKMKDGKIQSVTVDGPNETPDVGGKALDTLKQQIMDAQSAEIDGVSGATITSDAVRGAVAKALAQARGEAVTGNVPAEGDLFVPGTYTATAVGFGGEFDVVVTVTGKEIVSIEIPENHETVNIGTFAVEMLPEKMVKAQSVHVDALSGATVSGNAIKNAVGKALSEAGADLSAMPVVTKEVIPTAQKKQETITTDVVVVGAGGAGMTAAINVKQAGKDALILEKMPYVGGNTTRASGGMNAAGTKMQEEFLKHLTDEKKLESLKTSTVENFVADTIKSGHGINDEALVRTMAENSSDAIDWLASIGAPLPEIAATGSTVHMYLHEPEDGSAVGEFLVKFYRNKLAEMNIPVMTETEATELIVENGAVVGVIAESADTVYTVRADAVILATGGFGGNKEMLVNYGDESMKYTVSTNAAGITGDGIRMALAIGADTVDMEQIQLHPTVYSSGMLVSERVRSNGAILVNLEGNRFVNDLAGRDTVSQAELKQPEGCAFIVYDSRYADQSLYKKYETNGMTVSGNTPEELAKAMGFDDAATANFLQTAAKWNDTVNNGAADEFGRGSGLESLEQAPFYAIKIAPGIHHTMGGVKINTNAQVVGTDGNVIPGLLAAGEVTGGVHGGNRVGGNAVCDIVVFGRIAAASALAYCD